VSHLSGLAVRGCWTRFSGVSEQHIKDATVCFGDVLQRVEAFVGRDTILLGHGLENDLKAMRVYS
jgi:RNA exonuclease 1